MELRSGPWPVVLLSVIAAVVLWQDSGIGTKLDIVPDSTEYALAAHRFATSGNYGILVDGNWLPPRYAPWFSVCVLAPAYFLVGTAIGNAIFPIVLFGIAGIAVAFFLGKRIGGDWGGTAGALALLAFSKYRLWSRSIMIEIPAAALLLLACLLYVRLRGEARDKPAAWLLPGIVIAFAALFRPVFAAAVLPFCECAVDTSRWGSTLRKLAFLCGPLIAAGTAAMACNAVLFGSPFRSGYQYWTSVPYDYARLTFSLSYVASNFVVLRKTNAIYLMCLAVLLWIVDRRFFPPGRENPARKTALRAVGEFLLLGLGPVVTFHQLYFYPADRFYFPVLVLLFMTIGALAGSWLDRLPRKALAGLLAVVLLGACVVHRGNTPLRSNREIAADEIGRHTPEDAWIVSGLEPAYLEYVAARDSRRRIVPISRHVEYAGKLVTPNRIPDPDPPPLRWDDHRCPGLLRGGAREAVPFVASEQFDGIAEQLSRGTRIFLETASVDKIDQPIVDELRQRFQFIAVTPTLFELQPRMKAHG
jgi:4-amino-4-deoxy-L-arabinose transferase-like glycosyltransferase